MSFPSFLPRIALAPARSASSSSSFISPTIPSSLRSCSTSIKPSGLFSICKPPRSLFASSPPPAPPVLRSYSTTKPSSRSKPTTNSAPLTPFPPHSPRSSRPPLSSSSTPFSSQRRRSSSAQPSPPPPPPPQPEVETEEPIPASTPPLHGFQRWKELNSRPRSTLTREEKLELSDVVKQAEWNRRIKLYQLDCKGKGYVSMDGSSSNDELQTWWEEVGQKTLKGREVWDEFVVTRPVRSPSSSSAKTIFGFFKPNVDDGFRSVVPLSIALFTTFVLYLGAAYATQEVEARIDPCGNVAIQLGALAGWSNVTLALGLVASAIFAVKSAGARPGASRSLLGALDRFLAVSWTPFRRSYAHSLMFGHTSRHHLFSNLGALAVFGFFAYPYFDERGVWSLLKRNWLYLRDIPGSINSSWAISGPPPAVEEPKKTSTGVFHFLVFILTACATEAVVRQAHHSFFVLPRAQKTIARLLQNPSETRSLTPSWYFIPDAKKIYLAETIQATFGAKGAFGMSSAPFALASLGFLQMAFNWHPIYLPFQYMAYRFIKRDLLETYETRWEGVDLNHNLAILFGLVYFFVGDSVWDWFLDKAARLRTWLGLLFTSTPRCDPPASPEPKEESDEDSSLIGWVLVKLS